MWVMGSPRELFMALPHKLEDRIGICFPLSQVSPLVLEPSSQWDEGTRDPRLPTCYYSDRKATIGSIVLAFRAGR